MLPKERDTHQTTYYRVLVVTFQSWVSLFLHNFCHILKIFSVYIVVNTSQATFGQFSVSNFVVLHSVL